MEEQKKYELFDRYLRGELEEKELDDFLERLESDEELKEEFTMYQYLVEGIREHEKHELKAFISKKRNEEIKYIGNPWSKSFTYAAAAILIGFGLLYVVLNNQVNDQDIAVNDPVTVPQIPETPITQEEEVVKEPVKPVFVEPRLETDVPEEDPSFRLRDMIKGIDGGRGREDGGRGIGDDGSKFPPLGEPNRMASSGIGYPLKEDSRILDTLFTLSILFEKEVDQTIDTGNGSELVTNFTHLSEKILVQFWESPINYKGYRFDGRKLVLFGLDTFSQVELKYRVVNAELKVYDIYLVYGKLHVKLIDNNRYNAYIRETNPSILNELK